MLKKVQDFFPYRKRSRRDIEILLKKLSAAAAAPDRCRNFKLKRRRVPLPEGAVALTEITLNAAVPFRNILAFLRGNAVFPLIPNHL